MSTTKQLAVGECFILVIINLCYTMLYNPENLRFGINGAGTNEDWVYDLTTKVYVKGGVSKSLEFSRNFLFCGLWMSDELAAALDDDVAPTWENFVTASQMVLGLELQMVPENFSPKSLDGTNASVFRTMVFDQCQNAYVLVLCESGCFYIPLFQDWMGVHLSARMGFRRLVFHFLNFGEVWTDRDSIADSEVLLGPATFNEFQRVAWANSVRRYITGLREMKAQERSEAGWISLKLVMFQVPLKPGVLDRVTLWFKHRVFVPVLGFTYRIGIPWGSIRGAIAEHRELFGSVVSTGFAAVTIKVGLLITATAASPFIALASVLVSSMAATGFMMVPASHFVRWYDATLARLWRAFL
jgi:hypothetical protein